MPTAADNETTAAPGVVGRRQGTLLLLLAFVGGITSLGIEISASRLLAPFFGTTTPIWGALIGLILLYLTLGYFIGGWAADRWPRADYLYRISALAAALVLLIPLISRPVLLFSQQALNPRDPGQGFNIPGFVGALIAVVLLFAPSVILLGMVSPYVIRLRVASVGAAGRASGTVYAISTAGSILGAFLPAFWWIPSFGTRATLYGLGAVMLLVSLGGLGAGRYRGAAPLALLCALPLLGLLLGLGPVRPANGGTLLYDSDSEYGYIQVTQNGDARLLILNEGLAIHSIYEPKRRLTGGPWDYFTLAPLYGNRHWDGQKPGRVLIVGLAGGTVARQLTTAFGPVPIDGVEIDPRIIDVGRRYFDMNEPNLNAIAADGRYYLDTTDHQYDLIAIDAYRQPYIPFQLTTKEFFESCRRHLNPGGVLIVNVGRAPGDYRLVDAVSGTLGAVFPEIYQEDVAASLNTMVFASNQPIQPSEVSANYQSARSSGSGLLTDVAVQASAGPAPVHVDPHQPIYTDDLAPVERLVDSIVFGYLTGQPVR